MQEGSCFFTSPSAFIVCRFFDDGHSYWCETYLIVFLISISLILAVLNIFSSVYWLSVCLLWRNDCLGLLPIFWLDCLFFWYWTIRTAYRFWRLTLCQLLHLQLFLSHSEGCLFVLFLVSLQKLLSLISSHLLIFVFISITLDGGSKRILLHFMSRSALPILSSKSFIISGLTFR